MGGDSASGLELEMCPVVCDRASACCDFHPPGLVNTGMGTLFTDELGDIMSE